MEARSYIIIMNEDMAYNIHSAGSGRLANDFVDGTVPVNSSNLNALTVTLIGAVLVPTFDKEMEPAEFSMNFLSSSTKPTVSS